MSPKKSKKASKKSSPKKSTPRKLLPAVEAKKEQPEEEPKGPGGPRITKGSSSGDYATPKEFIKACEKKFFPLVYDLAASEKNARTAKFFTIVDDALKHDWVALAERHGVGFWLNPPFANIGPWAEKCLLSSKGAEILFLVPSSTGAKWFRNNCFKKADVYFLDGRLTFEGQTTPYPKDCVLVHFHPKQSGLLEIWDWRKELVEEERLHERSRDGLPRRLRRKTQLHPSFW
jgi:phage N-6-adenine-methyltransferase